MKRFIVEERWSFHLLRRFLYPCRLAPASAGNRCHLWPVGPRAHIPRPPFCLGVPTPPDPAAHGPDCSIRLPSRNLSGAVLWMHLRNVSVLRVLDLSGNALRGSIPSGFWSAPALLQVNLADNAVVGALWLDPAGPQMPVLRSLDLSGNQFTRATGLAPLPRLEILDLSRNSLSFVPPGLETLQRLRRLDLSHNPMRASGVARWPSTFSRRAGLRQINGVAQREALKMFGETVSVEGSSLHFASKASVAHSSSPAPSVVVRRQRHELICSCSFKETLERNRVTRRRIRSYHSGRGCRLL
ncbi:STYKc [Musa troglodytarum]|uniref:STYKc n=1 Tax=Musa troglodytarum TaxID=320322 RepID=A0A9E7FSG6_9LILI|nr:STYKc [Musa troglodytarum]